MRVLRNAVAFAAILLAAGLLMAYLWLADDPIDVPTLLAPHWKNQQN